MRPDSSPITGLLLDRLAYKGATFSGGYSNQVLNDIYALTLSSLPFSWFLTDTAMRIFNSEATNALHPLTRSEGH